MANPNPPNQWPKGKSANPNGRMKLPEWFKESTPSALAMIVAVGTGRVHGLDEDTPEELAARQLAASDSPTPLRLAAANNIVDRVVGKPKELIEHSGDIGAPTTMVIEIRRTAPVEKFIDGLTTKRAPVRDAE